MVRLDEEDVPGNPGAPLDAEAEARALALDGLLSPLSAPPDLGPMASQGQAAQSLGDAARAQGMPETWAGRDATAGLGDRDIVAPRAGGSATMPDVPAYDPRRDHASAVARPTPAAAPATPTSAAMPAPPVGLGAEGRDLATQASSLRTAAEAPAPQAKASAQRGESALDREMRAAQEARARRMIGNAFGTVVEMAGSLATGVPIQPGQATPAGPAEDEARIAREHRLAAAQKDREGREAALEAARAEREATLEDREFGLRERALEIQAARAGQPQTPRDLDVARAEQIRNALADREARRDPTSPQSQAAQASFMAVLDGLPPSIRRTVAGSFDEARVRGMSADSLAAVTAQLARVTPRVGAGGGGGGAASGARAERRGALIARMQREGNMSEAEARATVDSLGTERAAATLASDALARSRSTARMQTAGEEILPGVFAGVDLSPGEARSLRDGFASMRTSAANMTAVEEIANRYGTTGVLSPEARAEMRPRLVTLRAMVAQMGNTGVINPTEVPTINAALPNPTDVEQMTVGDFRAQLRAWRSQLDASVRSGLVARGVDDDGVRAAMGMLHGGGSARRPSQPSGTTPGTAATPVDVARVPMINPDGRRMMVRADQRDAALARGWREAP